MRTSPSEFLRPQQRIKEIDGCQGADCEDDDRFKAHRSSLHPIAEFDIADGQGEKCDRNYNPQQILHKTSNPVIQSRAFRREPVVLASSSML
jgi:hypothetical protein